MLAAKSCTKFHNIRGPVDYDYNALRHSNFLPPIKVEVNTESEKVAVFNMRQHHSTSTNRSLHQLPAKLISPNPQAAKKLHHQTLPKKRKDFDPGCSPSDSARCRADIRRPRRPAWGHTAQALAQGSGRVATMALLEGRRTCCRGRGGCRPEPGQR